MTLGAAPSHARAQTFVFGREAFAPETLGSFLHFRERQALAPERAQAPYPIWHRIPVRKKVAFMREFSTRRQLSTQGAILFLRFGFVCFVGRVVLTQHSDRCDRLV